MVLNLACDRLARSFDVYLDGACFAFTRTSSYTTISGNSLLFRKVWATTTDTTSSDSSESRETIIGLSIIGKGAQSIESHGLQNCQLLAKEVHVA